MKKKNNRETILIFTDITGYGDLVNIHQLIREFKHNYPLSNLIFYNSCHYVKIPLYRKIIRDMCLLNPDINEVWLKKKHSRFLLKTHFFKDIIQMYNISKIVYVSANHWHISNKILKKKGDVKGLTIPYRYKIWAENWLKKNIDLEKKIVVAHIRESVIKSPSEIYTYIRDPNFNNWLKLFKKIIDDLDVIILRIGLNDLTPININGVIDLTNKNITFLQEAALIASADLFLGCESGPNVMAGALKIPSVLGSYVNQLCIPQMNLENQIVLYKKFYDKNGKKLDIKNIYHFKKTKYSENFLIYDTEKLKDNVNFKGFNFSERTFMDWEKTIKCTNLISTYDDTPIEEIYKSVKKLLNK
ncbi:MAG: hypothetical protein ACFFDN_01450 [Candidatus Hodarchaeota archaeon]